MFTVGVSSRTLLNDSKEREIKYISLRSGYSYHQTTTEVVKYKVLGQYCHIDQSIPYTGRALQ